MQILPDGTVKIKNSATGEEKIVKPDELPNYGVPYTKYQAEKNAYNESVLNQPAQTATEVKNQSAYKGATGLLDVLEQNFTAAKGGEYTGMGALVAGTKKNIAGKLNLDKPAGIYNREKSGFTANLKTITGDTGVMTEKDYARIESLLPKFTDDPEMATQFFKDMRQIIANKFGGQPTESKYQLPEVKGGLLAAVAPNVSNMFKSVGNLPKIVDLSVKEAKEKGLLGAPSPELLSLITPGSKPEEFDDNRALNALKSAWKTTTTSQGAAGEVATPLMIGSAIKNALPTILNPRATLSAARNTLAEEASKDTSKMISPMK
jgi:hypothetical protein